MTAQPESRTSLRTDALRPARPAAAGRRSQVQITRRPRRRELDADTTLTDSWPPRLNTKL
jgi:hypothetical protein